METHIKSEIMRRKSQAVVLFLPGACRSAQKLPSISIGKSTNKERKHWNGRRTHSNVGRHVKNTENYAICKIAAVQTGCWLLAGKLTCGPGLPVRSIIAVRCRWVGLVWQLRVLQIREVGRKCGICNCLQNNTFPRCLAYNLLGGMYECVFEEESEFFHKFSGWYLSHFHCQNANLAMSRLLAMHKWKTSAAQPGGECS